MGIETSDTEFVKIGDDNNCINALDLRSNQANQSSPDFKVFKLRSFVKKYATIFILTGSSNIFADTLRTNNKPICIILLQHTSGQNWHE